MQSYTAEPPAGDEAEVGSDGGQQPDARPVADITSPGT